MNSSTPFVRSEQENPAIAGALARLQARWAREDQYPQIPTIGQLAVALRWARECIAHLLELADEADGDKEVVPTPELQVRLGERVFDINKGLTWGELAFDLAGWDYNLVIAENVLQSNFDNILEGDADVSEDDETEASEDLADVPTIAELPPARGTPYWLQ